MKAMKECLILLVPVSSALLLTAAMVIEEALTSRSCVDH